MVFLCNRVRLAKGLKIDEQKAELYEAIAEEIINRKKYRRKREKLLREQEDMVRRAETAETYQKYGINKVFSAATKRRMDALFVINPSRVTRVASEFLDCDKNLSEQGIEILIRDTDVVGLPEADFYATTAKTTESMTD